MGILDVLNPVKFFTDAYHTVTSKDKSKLGSIAYAKEASKADNQAGVGGAWDAVIHQFDPVAGLLGPNVQRYMAQVGPEKLNHALHPIMSAAGELDPFTHVGGSVGKAADHQKEWISNHPADAIGAAIGAVFGIAGLAAAGAGSAAGTAGSAAGGAGGGALGGAAPFTVAGFPVAGTAAAPSAAAAGASSIPASLLAPGAGMGAAGAAGSGFGSLAGLTQGATSAAASGGAEGILLGGGAGSGIAAPAGAAVAPASSSPFNFANKDWHSPQTYMDLYNQYGGLLQQGQGQGQQAQQDQWLQNPQFGQLGQGGYGQQGGGLLAPYYNYSGF